MWLASLNITSLNNIYSVLLSSLLSSLALCHTHRIYANKRQINTQLSDLSDVTWPKKWWPLSFWICTLEMIYCSWMHVSHIYGYEVQLFLQFQYLIFFWSIGFGVEQLRDGSLETYWQSDGPQPHMVNIQFRRKMTIHDICIYADFKADESYTPNRLQL